MNVKQTDSPGFTSPHVLMPGDSPQLMLLPYHWGNSSDRGRLLVIRSFEFSDDSFTIIRHEKSTSFRVRLRKKEPDSRAMFDI